MQLINDTIILTKEMKDILGDVVEYAYIKKPSWSSKKDFEGVYSEMLGQKARIEPVDSYPIFVKLTNGKTFTLWSSEWGGIRSETEKGYLND
ncbi:hypothetical protein QP741_00640 [Bacillus subtilis]|nr:hypothetical protein [Bacillus subtilis]MDK8206114.1 hypothetical protein [Bacillus subtilis]